MSIKTYSEHLRDAKGCGKRWRILILKPNNNQQSTGNLSKFRIVPCRCNSKACIDCSRLYFNKVKNSFKSSLVSNKWRFFTLSSVHHRGSEVEDLRRLEVHFRKLRKKLKRLYPDFQYIAIRELSPEGMWHIHGLWNIYIPLKRLSSYWKSISGAYRCNLQKVWFPDGAIGYIFKYCFKSTSNHSEKEMLYNADKRKFSCSKYLLSPSNNNNPYTSESRDTYSASELKEKLIDIIRCSKCWLSDFSHHNYPYFDDLIRNVIEICGFKPPRGSPDQSCFIF